MKPTDWVPRGEPKLSPWFCQISWFISYSQYICDRQERTKLGNISGWLTFHLDKGTLRSWLLSACLAWLFKFMFWSGTMAITVRGHDLMLRGKASRLGSLWSWNGIMTSAPLGLPRQKALLGEQECSRELSWVPSHTMLKVLDLVFPYWTAIKWEDLEEIKFISLWKKKNLICFLQGQLNKIFKKIEGVLKKYIWLLNAKFALNSWESGKAVNIIWTIMCYSCFSVVINVFACCSYYSSEKWCLVQQFLNFYYVPSYRLYSKSYFKILHLITILPLEI